MGAGARSWEHSAFAAQLTAQGWLALQVPWVVRLHWASLAAKSWQAFSPLLCESLLPHAAKAMSGINIHRRFFMRVLDSLERCRSLRVPHTDARGVPPAKSRETAK